MSAVLGRGLQRLYRLSKELEPVLVERVADPRRPLHLLAAFHQVDVVFLIAVDAIAACILGRSTRAVGRRQKRGNIVRAWRDWDDTHARAEPERAFVSREPELADDSLAALRTRRHRDEPAYRASESWISAAHRSAGAIHHRHDGRTHR